MHVTAHPATDVWHAPTAAVLYALPPHSTVTVALDASGLETGGCAGLAILARPCAWLGVDSRPTGRSLVHVDDRSGRTSRVPLGRPQVWLRVVCDLGAGTAEFRYSADGKAFSVIGEPYLVGPGLPNVSGLACSIFACAPGAGATRGVVAFDSFMMSAEPDRRR
jgi:hypothetical protein